MNFSAFLELNGALYGKRRKSDDFELPERRSIFRSTRFGEHSFDLDQKFLMIVPVKDAPRARSSSPRPKAVVKTRSSAAGQELLRSPLSREEESWESVFDRIIKFLMGCKAHAASFFW